MESQKRFLQQILSVGIVLFFMFVSIGCNNSKDTETTSVNIGGTWTSYHVFNNNGETIETPAQYTLNIVQSNMNLNATLDINDNVTAVQIPLTGIIYGEDFNLSGKLNEDHYLLSGIWENNTSIQVNLIKNPDTTQMEMHTILMRSLRLKVEAIINKYDFSKKCGDSEENTIVLIHGLNSNEGIWNNLINQFKEKNICDDFSVWTYQYDWTKSINLNGQDLLNKINLFMPNTQPVIVAHSLGGLVARSYIGQRGEVKKLITLGTPHEGVILAEITKLIHSFFPNNHDLDSLSDLSPDSDFFANLNANEYEISQQTKYLVLNGIIGGSWQWDGFNSGWKWYDDYPTLIKAGYWIYEDPILPKDDRLENDGIVPQYSSRFESSPFVERVDPKQFAWLCHDWLPYKDEVMSFVIEKIKELPLSK